MASDRLENPELIEEYLVSLQTQIDSLLARNEALRNRITRLEADRDKLTLAIPRRRRPQRTDRPLVEGDATVDIPDIGSIPDIELPDFPPRRPLKVATVLDGFSSAGFRYEFDMLELSARNWREQVEGSSPDLLLVESAYRGHDGSWSGRIARFGQPSSALSDLVKHCNHAGIPTAFWNKEDPINHDWFTASASLFDWIFTVDSNMVDRYRRRFGHDRVATMQFAAQPLIHHPGGNSRRVHRVAFAGTFYAAKHAERRAQAEMLLDPARQFGLHIFDRMGAGDDSRFSWPPEYQSHIVGSLTYPQTLEAYRRYQTFINVNTVVNSPTMCARRVYELLATGTHVVSGPSQALTEVPILVASSIDEARAAFAESMSAGRNEEGIDWIMDGQTVGHRVDSLLERVL